MKSKNNISYEEYLELVRQEVAVRTGKRVQLQTIRKNNGLVLDGLLILTEDTNVSPTIYLNGYYREFLANGMDAVAEQIIALYEENKPELPFDISKIMDISKVQPHIKMKLINYEENRELLKEVPYIQILDLAVVFMIVLETEYDCQFATILIHNKFIDYWKIETDSLYKTAKENMRNDFQTIAMEDIAKAVMDEALVEEMEFKMHVLTTHYRLYGAVGMLNKELLNAFMQKHQTEKLIILPSSVHEVLLIPCNEKMTENDLAETDLHGMVREVNETELEPEEYLSNNAYVYDENELKFFE